MVIELRSDVKHIDERISELVEVAKTNNNRIVALETFHNQEIGRARSVATSATIMSVVVSVVVSIVAIAVSWMVE
jgi:hypothetical protein